MSGPDSCTFGALDSSKESSHKARSRRMSSGDSAAVGLGRFVAADGSASGREPPLRWLLILPVGQQAEERAGGVAKVVDGGKAFVNGGLRWLADYSALRVGVHAEGGQVAAVGCVVIAGVPAVADVAGARDEQDRRLEFAGMHVVVVSHKSIP